MKNFFKTFLSLLIVFLWFVAIGKVAVSVFSFSADMGSWIEPAIKIAAAVVYVAVVATIRKKKGEPIGAYADPEYRLVIVIVLGFISTAVARFSKTAETAEAMQMVDRILGLGAFLACMVYRSYFRVRNHENESYVDKAAPQMWVLLTAIVAICGLAAVVMITPARGIISGKAYWFINGVGFLYIATSADVIIDQKLYGRKSEIMK